MKTCDTCRRIIQNNPILQEIEQVDIKTNPPTAEEVDMFAQMAGNYEAIFNNRAQKLKDVPDRDNLNEARYRELLLSHYSYLKRPVIISADAIFAGNSALTIQQAIDSLS